MQPHPLSYVPILKTLRALPPSVRALSLPLRSARCAPSLRALLRACPPPLFTRIAPSLHVLPSSLDVGLRVLSPSPHALPPLSTRRSPSLRKLRAALRGSARGSARL